MTEILNYDPETGEPYFKVPPLPNPNEKLDEGTQGVIDGLHDINAGFRYMMSAFRTQLREED